MTATTTSTSTASSTTLSSSSCDTSICNEDSATNTFISSAKKAKAKPRRSVHLGRLDKKSNPKSQSTSTSKPKGSSKSKHREKYYETEIPIMNYNPDTGKSVIWGYQSVFRVSGGKDEEGGGNDECTDAANTVCDDYPTGQPREYTFVITTPETFLVSEDGKV